MSLYVTRYTARAVIIHDGAVLFTVGGRAGAGRYHLPGGGQDPGEGLRDTVAREVLEETGLAVAPGELLWVRETTYPLREGGGYRHRVDVVFAATVLGDPAAARLGHDAGSTRAVVWVPLGDLGTVDLQPPGLATLLPEVAAGRPVPRYSDERPAVAGRDARLG
ncbi:NUDIX domain-containing protein [Longispora albida]|uniref:NUDIX domain-containing protein n=1 Tax=Longispora albida TaxID=203523 RepID=UPI000364BD50|nr:NUDIX domain-containing protein [Longispora albida]